MLRVVIAGAGIAGLETLLGLRALAAGRVDLTLLAPVGSFAYRPLSSARPFTFGARRTLSITDLARDVGARHIHDGLAYVDDSRAQLLTSDGDLVPYDVLVVAIGARQVPSLGRVNTWFGGDEGSALFARLLRDLERRALRTVAFVVPRDAAWPVDAYELCLVAAAAAATHKTEILLLTAEKRPLGTLGGAASDAVHEELEQAGVQLITEVEVHALGGHHQKGQPSSRLRLTGGQVKSVDRVLSLPVSRGPATGGVPHDSRGFIPVDGHARVKGSRRIFAVGDATRSRLAHSSLAGLQAQAAAEAIAAEAGEELEPTPWSPVLHGILAVPPHFPDGPGSIWQHDGEPLTDCLWWPPGHVAGRYLAPFLAARDPGLRPGIPWHPRGLPIAVELESELPEPASTGDARSPDALRQEARDRQLLAMRRSERQGERTLVDMERHMADFERREREVIDHLQAAGYLQR